MGQRIEQHVMERVQAARVIPMRRARVVRIRTIAAAAILITLIVGGYYFMTQHASKENGVESIANGRGGEKLIPGSSKAILTLGSGENITLDSAKAGTLTRQGETTLVISNGVLTYKAEGNAGTIAFNTVRTPNGGQYHLKLADGTDVWLNAASSLRFPTAFQGKERLVEIIGEAYFEVAHDAAKPFKVATNGTLVEVLGTHFNVDAYEDDGQWKTTLVEGKIKIVHGNASAVLLPGYQARVSVAKGMSVVKDANVEAALAWKKGNFQFENADLKTVMNQIARWYDVEVVYNGTVPKEHYRFIIPRSTPASSLIRILNAGGIHCKLDGKKIIVSK
jgi:hypothetical protein